METIDQQKSLVMVGYLALYFSSISFSTLRTNWEVTIIKISPISLSLWNSRSVLAAFTGNGGVCSAYKEFFTGNSGVFHKS